MAVSALTLQEQLVPTSPRTSQRLNHRMLFDGMQEGSVTASTASTAGPLFDEMPRPRSGMGASHGRAPRSGEKTASAAILALAHASKHAEVAELFCRLQMDGVPISKFMLPSVLKACARLRDSRMLRAMHVLVIKCALCQHVVVGTALVSAYIDFGLMDDAGKAFAEMDEPNMVSWSVIIGGYVHSCRWDEAWDAFSAMQRAEMHALAVSLGFERNTTVWNCLIDMYSKCGDMDNCRSVFETMVDRDQVSWNTIIASYVRLGLCEEALDMVMQMQESGFTVDRFTLGSGVAACAHLADIDNGRAFHGYLIRRALDTDAIRGSALVDMYGKCGLTELARVVFNRMDERNYVSWDALLSGYVENGQVDLALSIFRQMESANIKANQHTFVNLLKLCGNRKYTEYGRQIHAHAIKAIHQMNVVLETELIDMYAKCGCIEVARLLFLRMNERNMISWNALLSGYVGDGQPAASISIYRQMEQASIRPDQYTLAGLLSLCWYQGHLRYGKQIHAHLIKTGYETNVLWERARVVSPESLRMLKNLIV
ncbi:hypothetical protein ACQ4PT_034089 [Festuca glaucescens]